MEQLEGDSRTRRDALARNLCARICDGRRSIDDLQALDAALSIFESEEIPRASLRYMLEHDRYDEDCGTEIERTKKHWWNLGMAHATALERAFNALAELVEAPALDLRVKSALTGGE